MDIVYLLDIREYEDPQGNPKLLLGLPRDRAEKTLRYRKPEDRKSSLVAGMLINEFLKFSGNTPEQLKITEMGKPYVENAYFNVSHSGNYVCGVYSDDKDVACDIERIKERSENVINKCFSAGEIAYLDSSKNRVEAFTEIWTRKESYVKLKGTGILDVLKDIDTFDMGCHFESFRHDDHVVTICSYSELINKIIKYSL